MVETVEVHLTKDYFNNEIDLTFNLQLSFGLNVHNLDPEPHDG